MSAWLKAGARLVIQCCALYLISILFLLLGVHFAMQSPLLGGTGVSADLPLLAVMNLYDVALLGVLGFLFARPERREDGYYVAMAAVGLTLDPTFFNHRLYTHDAWYGLSGNALLLMASVAKLLVLAWGCRVPLSRPQLVTLLGALGFVYLGPAPFSFPGLCEPRLWLYALSWTPLLLAFVAPTPDDMVPDPDDPTETASIRAREFRIVAWFLPFVAVARHLWQMPLIYDVPLDWAHAAGMLLALVVACARTWPEEAANLLPGLGMLAAGSLWVSLPETGSPGFRMLGVEVSTFRLALLGNVLVGGYLATRFRGLGFRLHAVLSVAAFLFGGSPHEIMEFLAGPGGWLVLGSLSVGLLVRKRSAGPALMAWVSATCLVAEVTAGRPFTPGSLHALLLGIVFLPHAFPEDAEATDILSSMALGGLLAHSFGAGWVRGDLGYQVMLGLEMAGCAVGWALTGWTRYKAPCLAAVGVGTLRSPLLGWMARHAAVSGLVLAFGTLAGGFWVSLHKDELLGRLGTDGA